MGNQNSSTGEKGKVGLDLKLGKKKSKLSGRLNS